MFSGYSFYLEQDDGVYRYIFCTSLGHKYAIYFAIASEYFGLVELPERLASYGFSFGIARMGDDVAPRPFDPRIKVTVQEVIEDFLQNCVPAAVLLVNYDDHDGKQEKRFKCFCRWFDELNNGDLYKEDTEIILPGEIVRISVIFEVSRNDAEEIRQDFFEVRNKLIEEK